MRNKYFDEKAREISLVYDGKSAREVADDLDFCLELFSHEIEEKMTPFEVSFFGIDMANHDSRGTSHHHPYRNFITDVYARFLEKTYSIDSLANKTLEFGPMRNMINSDDTFSKDSFYRSNSVIYTTDGELRGEKFLKRVASLCPSGIAENIMRTDDARAAIEIITNPIFSESLPKNKSKLHDFFSNPLPNSKCYKAIIPDRKESPLSYLNKILSINKDASMKDLNEIYKPEMAKIVGGEFFYHKIKSHSSTTVQDELISRLVRDGADWYVGLKQAEMGHHAHLQYSSRERDFGAEVSELVGVALKSSALARTNICTLLKEIGFDAIQELITKPSEAAVMHSFTQDNRYIAQCTNKSRRKIISSQLGL